MKMKKLVAVLALISFNAHAAPDCHELPSCESLGFICSSEECGDLKALSCPFDLSKKTCWPKETNCELGSILYSDFKCYEAACGRTPIAIIYDIENRLAIQLITPFSLKWSPTNDYDIPDLANGVSNSNGKENTAIIVAYGQTNNIPYPAAEYCYNLTWGDVATGTWWLPSAIEADILYNISKTSPIKEIFAKYNLVNDRLHVSNEYRNNYSYNYQPYAQNSKGGYYAHYKSDNCRIHCIINY